MHAPFLTARDDDTGMMTAPDKMAALVPPPCPECGVPMRLATIEPQITDKPLSAISYDCACGATDTRMVD